MSNKRNIELPTAAEDAAITAAAITDHDAQPLTEAQLQQMTPMRKRGRPEGSNKVATNVRFDRDVLDAFKAAGDGWQTRMNDALRDYAQSHHMMKR